MTAQQVKTGQSLPGRLVFVLLLGCTISIQSIYAHDFGGSSSGGGGDPPPPPGPPCNSCPCSGPGGGGGGGGSGNSNDNPSGSGGKPVSFYNGAEEMALTDLVVNGVFPIVIQRKYDSRSSYDSPLGYGWAFLHDRRLYEYPDNSVIVRHGCGTRDRYVYSGGAYVTPTGSMLASLSEEPDGSFRLKYLNGITDTFDSQGRLIAATDARGNRHEYTYDPLGKLPLVGSSKESISPMTPMTVAYTYRLTRIDVRGADGALTGRYVTFAYDPGTGRLASVASDDGRSVSYQHDSTQSLTLGNLTQIDGLEGIVSTYAYADPLDPHNLTSITPSQGRTPIINTYDDQDRVTRQEEGARRMDIVYNVPYTRTTVTRTIRDQNGLNPYTAATTYEFDTTGRVTKLIDALGHETRYTYNAAKLLTRKEVWQKDGTTLSLLQAMNWTYDANGNKLTESVALDSGETITRSWTYQQNWIASEQVVSSAAPSKIFRTEYTFHFGADGRPTNIQSERRRKDDGTFQIVTFTYDSRNRLLTMTLPDTVQVVNEYTGDYLTHRYLVVGGTAIPEKEATFEYDAAGNLINSSDARENPTQYGYDDKGRLTSITNALDEQSVYRYDSRKLLEVETSRTVADGEGQVSKLIYDTRERWIGTRRKNDSGVFADFLTFQLDSEGQRLSMTDGANRTTYLAYDALGQLKSITDAAGKVVQFIYDAAGNRTSMLDAMNRLTRYEYDDLNRLTAVIELGIAPNLRTEYSYDAAGNMVAVRDPQNHVTTYEYDALSRNTRITRPLGQVIQYAYTNRDQTDFIVNAAGNKIDYEYAAWGGLSAERQYATASATVPDRTIGYTHDDAGNVLTITDDEIQSTPAYTVTYDALNRPYDESARYVPGGDRILNHRYDRYGNRRELTLQDGVALTNTYAYNNLNQLTAATLAGAPIAVSYFGNDDRQSVTLPNGVVELMSYRPNGPVESIQLNGPAAQIAQLAYTYDDALNLDTQTDQYGMHDFNFDGLDRLTNALRPGAAGLPNESYAWDGAGNREDAASAALYDYDANNRIVASPGLTYTFDVNGNLSTRSDGATFVHDPHNRLQQFSKAMISAAYVYDPLGRRIKKSTNGADTWFIWDGAALLAEYDGAGNRIRRYGYLNGDVVPRQLQDGNGTYYVHTDHLRAPRFVTNAAAQVVWRAKYETFGRAVVEEDVDGNSVAVILNVRLPGQYADAESGLHYNYFRTYDPAVGRYIESDPIGLDGGVNQYLYALANPVGYVDPLGLMPVCWDTFMRSRTDERRWVRVDDRSWQTTMLRGRMPGVSDNLDPNKPGQMPVWPGTAIELWMVEIGYTLTTEGITISRFDIYKWQCMEEITDECGNKKERYDSWEEDRVRAVQVKILKQTLSPPWMRWLYKIVKIIDVPWPGSGGRR